MTETRWRGSHGRARRQPGLRRIGHRSRTGGCSDLCASTADARRRLAAASPDGPDDLVARLAALVDGFRSSRSSERPRFADGTPGRDRRARRSLELEREAARARIIALDRHRRRRFPTPMAAGRDEPPLPPTCRCSPARSWRSRWSWRYCLRRAGCWRATAWAPCGAARPCRGFASPDCLLDARNRLVVIRQGQCRAGLGDRAARDHPDWSYHHAAGSCPPESVSA